MGDGQERIKVFTLIQVVFFLFMTTLVGGFLGWALAATTNIKNSERFTTFSQALPTKILDVNGEVITEFSSDEKREIIALGKLPVQMIDALLVREDRIFFSHKGFSYKAVARAVVGQLLHKSLGGGSTLTQQIAGTLFCDRSDMSIKRKIKELWWAVQMERRYSKNEIMELYLNKIYFGGGTYGVNAASKYYFGHEATKISPAEAAILVIQLSNPAYYNPFDHPNRAMERQRYVLDQMVAARSITKREADESFSDFWGEFDYTRTSIGAYTLREDKAPWFSEYVRRELTNLIYGSDDIYTGGFIVNTTLNLKLQKEAERILHKYIVEGNARYTKEHGTKSDLSSGIYVPMAELLALNFGIPAIKTNEARLRIQSFDEYLTKINPILDATSLITGIDSLKLGIVTKGNGLSKKEDERTTIEGTMICLQNETGYITALVGGSKFDAENQFIRATQAKLQPGSCFKPLYYTEAIDSRKFTVASIISDTPVVFHTSDGRPYIPQNFKGEWLGDIPLFYALIHSMNVPSLKVLDAIGFDAAINRAVSLLGIPPSELPSRAFNKVYPIGLGVCSVRPIELARAYSVIASGGHAITPIAIRNIQNRKGDIIINVEKDIRAKDIKNQILDPATAYVMTKLLEQTVQSGTLAGQAGKFIYRNSKGKQYSILAGGKTGTTQNWADAWTSGFTPDYTATFWFGFDRPGQSLGINITGATLAGFAWGEFMREANRGLSYRDFPNPDSAFQKDENDDFDTSAHSVVSVTICNESGLLATENCPTGRSHQSLQWFLQGTQPLEPCSIHGEGGSQGNMLNLSVMRLKNELLKSGERGFSTSEGGLKLDLDFLEEPPKPDTWDANLWFSDEDEDVIMPQRKQKEKDSSPATNKKTFDPELLERNPFMD